MSEAEIMLEPDAFEAVRRGAAPAPLPLDWRSQSVLVIESDHGRRTGRWIALEIVPFAPQGWTYLIHAWPPVAASLARNPAAARLARED